MRLNIFIILIFFLRTTKGDNSLPVFLLDFDRILSHVKIEPNPFEKISTEFFVDILHDSMKNSKVVIIFVDEILCTEDISTRDNKGTAYRHLHEGLLNDRVRYFPAVRSPYKSLQQVFANHNTNEFHVSDENEKLKMYETRNGHYYVYFEDRLNETRIETLRRHDLIIKEIYHAMRNFASGPVLAFYTGKNNPITVKKMKTMPLKGNIVSLDPGVTVESRDALFRFVGVYSSSSKRQSMFNQAPVVADERLTRRHLSTKVAYTDFDLEFHFAFKKDGWIIEDVALLEGGEEVGRTRMGAGAPWECSYVCGEPLVIINQRDGSAVTISHYQIQAFRRGGRSYDDASVSERNVLRQDETTPPEETTPTEEETTVPVVSDGTPTTAGDTAATTPADAGHKSFGKSVHCGPYFSSSIIAGLFVTSVCFGMLLVGVSALMNCVTNDRYDDPQGKPLSVGTEGGGG